MQSFLITKLMNKFIFTFFCIIIAVGVQLSAQIPHGYYNSVERKKGKELQIALSEIIKGHKMLSYSDVWIYYQYTDVKPNGKIWDIYSDNPNESSEKGCEYRLGQCQSNGNDCYNREHTFCQSWFGASTKEHQYTDMFHLYPANGWINTKRSNNPFGVVNTTISHERFENGSLLGTNIYPCAPNVKCFEPIDEYKGDIARSFFYMATRYMLEDQNFQAISPMTFKSQLQPWALNMFLEWHQLDPVSQKEIDRNNAIYAVQKNRNPFIDYPDWVEKIWGNDSIYPVSFVPEKPKIKNYAFVDSKTLFITFSEPMVAWTVENPLNYTMSNSFNVSSLKYIKDTLWVELGGLFNNTTTYKLTISNLLAKNMEFLDNAVISFKYPYTNAWKPILMWSFNENKAKPNTKTVYAADHNFSSYLSGTLFCNREYQSDEWISDSKNTMLNSFTGTTLGDLRTSVDKGQDISFENTIANGKSVVFKFSTLGYKNLWISMAINRSDGGFDKHQWEWSIDGNNFTFIPNTSTCPLSGTTSFVITTLDLSNIVEINDKSIVFLRLTFNGCIGSSGNNRIDNITIHGVSK